MDAVSLRTKIGGDWFFRGGAWWRLEPIAGIRTIARQMLGGEARFATIVATSAADRSLRVSWHWDVFGTLLSVESLMPPGGLMPTIADIYPAPIGRNARLAIISPWSLKAASPPRP